MKLPQILITLILALILAGCTTINSAPQTAPAYASRPWGITSFANNTEVPQAGNRAMSITANVLRAKGVMNLSVYQPYGDCNQLALCPNDAISTEKVLAWAQQHGICYVMMGAVNEWQYKVGLDGEPVAAVSLQLYDVMTRRVIWSAVGSKIGNGRSGLGNIAQDLINDMLSSLAVS